MRKKPVDDNLNELRQPVLCSMESLKRMIEVTLLWFGRLWIAAAIVGMVIVYFLLPSNLTNDWAMFHIAWVPMFAVPNPVNIVWWVATVVAALPGIGAFVVRDKLRKKRRAI